ncbi:MAG TPA: hypothetical protein VI386_32830 [Candidatus Sulfotelmatobacter sp.]
MPETNQLIFSFKEIVTALIKTHDIHEGIWGIFVNFGINAQNIGPSESELRPTAVIPVLQLGLLKFDKETNLSVDAAKVNPAVPTNSKTKKATH